MIIKITNKTHPMELQVVAKMLKGQGLKPTKFSPTEIRCEVPNEAWHKSIKEAVEFMTECGVEAV